MASSLTETFYDLNTSSIHPVYPQPTYPAPPPPSAPPSSWLQRVEGYSGDMGYPPGSTTRPEDAVAAVTSVSGVGGGAEDLGQGENTPVTGQFRISRTWTWDRLLDVDFLVFVL